MLPAQVVARPAPPATLQGCFRFRAAVRLGAVVVLPEPLLLQRVGDILGHVVLVVLGQHSVGLEHTGGVERTLCDHALPFAKQVRKNSLVGNRQGGAAIANLERDGQVVAAHQ